MSEPAPVTVTPILVADLLAEGERMPVYVHVIDHPDARVLVDTGVREPHPAAADLDPRVWPLDEQDLDLAGIDIVVNTHLHFDHCGGNHLFPGRPVHVQRRELDDARGRDGYTIREWVDAPGVRYIPVDGEAELLPGLRLVPAPGHTDGMQVVVIETGGRPVVVGGDVAVWFGELDEPQSEVSCWSAPSTPSWCGSPTSTSGGDRARAPDDGGRPRHEPRRRSQGRPQRAAGDARRLEPLHRAAPAGPSRVPQHTLGDGWVLLRRPSPRSTRWRIVTQGGEYPPCRHITPRMARELGFLTCFDD